MENPAASAMDPLINRLASELSEARRLLAAATQKQVTATRTLEGRTQELTEARAALSLLIATLDAADEGMIAVGHFGRAMHYNARFVEIWGIAADRLPTLTEDALLALQLKQARDPQALLADHERRRAHPDQEHVHLIELTDGRVLRCRAVPQRVRGKRVGTITSYADVTPNN
jgi:PAS domain-containing protein